MKNYIIQKDMYTFTAENAYIKLTYKPNIYGRLKKEYFKKHI
ncbi:MAG: hypothetical protein RL181_237 [Bacteroidota bacterium]|jgi:hypothetical protein